MTKLSSSLPKESEQNGLLSVNRALIDDPHEPITVVARILATKITREVGTGAEVATVAITEIEPLSGRRADLAESLLRGANEERCPRPEPLPVPEFLKKGKGTVVDFGTGEILDDQDEDGDDDD